MEQLTIATLIIKGPAVEHQEMIPVQYTHDGKNINPPLVIKGNPEDSKNLTLIVEDPDAPSGVWGHWIVCNMPVQHEIAGDSTPGKEGLNAFSKYQKPGQPEIPLQKPPAEPSKVPHVEPPEKPVEVPKEDPYSPPPEKLPSIPPEIKPNPEP